MEHEQVIVTNEQTGGRKGRSPARMSLIPGDLLLEIAKHYNVGAAKYDDHNWRKGYDWDLSYDACMRHLIKFWDGESIDEESGTHHLAAVVFHAIALMYFEKHHSDLDTRYKPDTELQEYKRKVEAVRDKASEIVAAPPPIRTWTVPSYSRAGKYHMLRLAPDGKLSCSCEGFTYRGECRHVDEFYR